MNLSQASESVLSDLLARFPENEQEVWLTEVVRLAEIIIRYQALDRKWRFNKTLGKNDFTKEVYNLCKEAACANPIIVAREPSRAHAPSPYTIDRWSKKYEQIGLKAFFRAPSIADPQFDNRLAFISVEAFKWINKNWRKYKSSNALYNALNEEAERNIWKIPSRSWIYRRWKEIPKIVSVYLFEGKDAYQSKLASYVPRDLSDLDALQVLCGDHREGDVTVHVGNGELARIWLTYWLDLRTSLIWGWYLSLTPNTEAITLAYADGINKFEAQPFSQPENGFYSYVYTDRGKSYRSHDIEGRTIKVHEKAADITGRFKYFLVDRNIGLVEEFRIKQLLAKVRNPKEKPIERTNKDFSYWEKNEFKGYCGSKPSDRPDSWYKLFEKHNKLLKSNNFNSPFISFDDYKTKIAERIDKHNSSLHERVNLGGISIVPIEEYKRLYTTPYKISKDIVVNLLLKSATRTVGKNGINCFRKNWHYWHDDMSKIEAGLKVQIKFTDQDYSKIWVVLPDKKIVEAELIEPVSFLNPNKDVLKQIKRIEAKKRAEIHNFHLLQQSRLRFETTEEYLSKSLPDEENFINSELSESSESSSKASVHLFPTITRNKSPNSNKNSTFSVKDVTEIESEINILPKVKPIKINEFE